MLLVKQRRVLPETIYCTGLTGFIGKNLMPRLLEVYDQIINFQRNQQYQLISKDSVNIFSIDDFQLNDSSPLTLINLATLYNPNPISSNQLLALIDSNIIFPSQLIEKFKDSIDFSVISTQSYLQLLPLTSQNQYSLSKEILKKNLEQNVFNNTNLYLFDSFGEGDTRNKVVDVFIKKILKGQPLTIPSNDVEINLSYAEDICTSIIQSINYDPGEYSIMSPNTLSLEDLAKTLMNIMNLDVEIIKKGNAINFLSEIKGLPFNIFPEKHANFNKSLFKKINSIKNDSYSL